jgi:hypothetical protein
MTLSERSVLRVHTSNRKKQNRGSYMLLELFRLFQPHNVLRFSISLPSSLVSTTRQSPPRHLPHHPDQYPTSRYQTHISIPSQYTPTQRHVPSRTPSTFNPGRTKQLQHSPRACTQPASQNAPLPVVREINKHASMHSTRASVPPIGPKINFLSPSCSGPCGYPRRSILPASGSKTRMMDHVN